MGVKPFFEEIGGVFGEFTAGTALWLLVGGWGWLCL